MLPQPVVVIEILSPSNKADTWADVYGTIPSVRKTLTSIDFSVPLDAFYRTA